MNIEYVKIADILEYENNPRNNDKAVEYVANSIRRFGFKVPVVLDSNNIIVAGHTRVKAAKCLGMLEVPCIVADDLTEEQVNAFRLVDNKTAELAGWDFVLLDEELAELRAAGVDVEEFGFTDVSDVDIDDLFEDEPKKEKEPKRIQCECCGEWFEVE